MPWFAQVHARMIMPAQILDLMEKFKEILQTHVLQKVHVNLGEQDVSFDPTIAVSSGGIENSCNADSAC